jgi:hypothetical protein
VRPCLDAVWNWTETLASDNHRRMVAATACGKNTNPSLVVRCMNEGWNTGDPTLSRDIRRMKAASRCAGAQH